MFGLLTVSFLGAGLAVVLAPRITTSALAMAFAFLNVAGMFVLLGAETVAAFQVLIYVGAITVLILYGVMFTPQQPRAYALFFLGLGGVLVRRNAVVILMCVELMLNAANLAFVAFSRRFGLVDERGSVFVVFVFVVAAAEVAVGLAIILAAYRHRPPVDVDEIQRMKG